jgi:hypothetical protein
MKRESGEGTSTFSIHTSADTRVVRVPRYCEDAMRHLFLPACFCLMTISGSTGSDTGVSLDRFFAVTGKEKKAEAREAETPVSADEGKNGQVPLVVDEQADDRASQPLADEATPLPLPRPVVKPVVSRSTREICDSLIEAAQTNGLPIPFFIHLLNQESGFRPDVVSRAGAQGIAQFMPETAAVAGLDNPFDPLQAIAASARLLRNLVKQFGNLGLAAAAYNAGPRRIHDWLAKKGKLPEETQNYVKTITGRTAKTWMGAAPAGLAFTLAPHVPCREAASLIVSKAPPSAVLPSARSAAASRSVGAAMIATRAHVKIAGVRAGKTSTIMAKEASGQISVQPRADHTTIPAKNAKGAIQIAAASKKNTRWKKLQLSQR